MEKERGIAGFTDAQDELEMVSTQKGDVDEKKGQILEDMSDMVSFIEVFQKGLVKTKPFQDIL